MRTLFAPRSSRVFIHCLNQRQAWKKAKRWSSNYEVDVAGAALHRSSITQSLWKLRCDEGSDAPPPPNPDGTRYPSQSRVRIRYDLTSDPELRARYESAFGTMRMGVLLEDMDALAGSCAWRHVDDADPATDPPILVTASIEEMLLKEELPLSADYKMIGDVAWTGRSSLVICVELIKKSDSAKSKVLSAVFTYVARKRDGSGAETVFPVIPQTDEEKERWTHIDSKQTELKKQRQEAKKTGKQGADPASVNALLQASRAFRDFPGQFQGDAVEMSRTSLRTAQMCQPQERNTAGHVFGGVLIRRALELSFATAYNYGGTEPKMVALERVDFLKPVHVGALLAFSSIVTFAENPPPSLPDAPGYVHVHVSARTWRPQKLESTLNNDFRFVFAIHNPARPLKAVVPSLRTEAEYQLRVTPRYPKPPSS